MRKMRFYSAAFVVVFTSLAGILLLGRIHAESQIRFSGSVDIIHPEAIRNEQPPTVAIVAPVPDFEIALEEKLWKESRIELVEAKVDAPVASLFNGGSGDRILNGNHSEVPTPPTSLYQNALRVNSRPSRTASVFKIEPTQSVTSAILILNYFSMRNGYAGGFSKSKSSDSDDPDPANLHSQTNLNKTPVSFRSIPGGIS